MHALEQRSRMVPSPRLIIRPRVGARLDGSTRRRQTCDHGRGCDAVAGLGGTPPAIRNVPLNDSRSCQKAAMKPSPAMTWALVAMTVAGCSNELDPSDASRAVHAHLRSVAPHALESDSFTVMVNTILQPAEGERVMRFHLAAWQPDSVTGASAPGTFPTRYDVRFTRSNQGWTMTEYGETMAEYAALLLASDWQARFDYLIAPLVRIDSVADAWSRERSDRAVATLEAVTDGSIEQGLAAYDRYERLETERTLGIPNGALRTLVDGLEIVPDSLAWGIEGEREDDPRVGEPIYGRAA